VLAARQNRHCSSPGRQVRVRERRVLVVARGPVVGEFRSLAPLRRHARGLAEDEQLVDAAGPALRLVEHLRLVDHHLDVLDVVEHPHAVERAQGIEHQLRVAHDLDAVVAALEVVHRQDAAADQDRVGGAELAWRLEVAAEVDALLDQHLVGVARPRCGCCRCTAARARPSRA
jgi:hypothetical protein